MIFHFTTNKVAHLSFAHLLHIVMVGVVMNKVAWQHPYLILRPVKNDQTERHKFGSQFYLMLVNNVLQKMRRRVTNKISLNKLPNLFILIKL